MSRVDQARRRAAHVDAGPNDESRVHADDASAIDAAQMAQEPFPTETPQRPAPSRPVPAVPPASDTPPVQNGRPLIERVNDALSEKVVIDRNILPESREQYRRLAGTLHHAQTASGLKVVLVTSAAPSEGKTLTSANLAMTFSESYRRSVLLIDGDLRRPSLHAVFNLPASAGLAEGLVAPDDRRLMFHQVSAGLALLPAGRPSSDPMAGLTSTRMQRVLDEARERFDWVIIDSPPVTLLPDANLLASMVDGTLLVVKADATPYELVNRAVSALGRNTILGVVLNRADAVSNAYYGYGAERYYGGAASAAR